jgi:hypothetical protein
MTGHDTTTGQSAGAVPVACSLASADLATQADRWEQLTARAMTDRAETPYGLRIVFRPGPGVEDELRRLVAVENQCCPWACWAVGADTQHVVLDVSSTGAGIATLHGMLHRRAEAVRPQPRAELCCGGE